MNSGNARDMEYCNMMQRNRMKNNPVFPSIFGKDRVRACIITIPNIPTLVSTFFVSLKL